MTDASARAALDVLAALAAMARDKVPPETALATIRALRARHGRNLDLVWEKDALSGAHHYDALLVEPGVGTYSLALCPENATPWPLRGVVSVREQDVLRVNGETLSLADALQAVDVLWDDADILRRLVDLCLLRDARRRYEIEVDAEQLQEALDRFRLREGLLTTPATEDWMAARGLDHVALEELVEGEAAALALRARVIDRARIDALWNRDPRAFDVADVVRFRIASADAAAAALAAITRGELGFYDALERELSAGRLVPVAGGAVASLRRRDLAEPYARAVFGGAAIAGPLEARGGHDIVRVVAIHRRERGDPAAEEALAEAAFDEWLAELRAKAAVEWYWGTVAQTARATR